MVKRLFVVCGAVAAFPAMASAAARYASPTPSGTMDCSSAANACDVRTAIESAGMNDDIYVPGNLGDYHVNSSISAAATPVHVHGTNGRPRLILAGSLNLMGPSTAEDLYIEGPGPSTTFGLQTPAGGSVDNVIVKVTDSGHACYFSGGHTLTNSVCWAAGAGDLAVETDGSNTFRNDTLIGGSEAAIKGFARNPDCSCAAATDTLVNVIARSGGTGHDLEANSDNSADMTFDVKYSNYATTITTGAGAPAKTHINGDATDQSTAPLFVSAANGDFHEALGSPTIDAGVNAAANGAKDFDGDPRIAHGTTDIGADEFERSSEPSGTVAAPCGQIGYTTSAGTIGSFATLTGTANPPPGVVLPCGLIGFTISGLTPGQTVTVTVRLPVPATGYYKFVNNVWVQLTSASFTGNTGTFTLTDGDASDDDGSANGTIVDPGAPASPVCTSIATCYTALGTTLPNPASASGKKAKHVAAGLRKRYRTIGKALDRAGASTAKKRAKLYAKTRRLVAALLKAAQMAAGKGTLGVPLPPLATTEGLLLAEIPS